METGRGRERSGEKCSLYVWLWSACEGVFPSKALLLWGTLRMEKRERFVAWVWNPMDKGFSSLDFRIPPISRLQPLKSEKVIKPFAPQRDPRPIYLFSVQFLMLDPTSINWVNLTRTNSSVLTISVPSINFTSAFIRIEHFYLFWKKKKSSSLGRMTISTTNIEIPDAPRS